MHKPALRRFSLPYQKNYQIAGPMFIKYDQKQVLILAWHGSFLLSVACYDVAIIGAGISGTYAAWRLRNSGLKIGIFEQSDRIGGRIYTHRLPGMPELHAELGAMYFMPQVHNQCKPNICPGMHIYIHTHITRPSQTRHWLLKAISMINALGMRHIWNLLYSSVSNDYWTGDYSYLPLYDFKNSLRTGTYFLTSALIVLSHNDRGFLALIVKKKFHVYRDPSTNRMHQWKLCDGHMSFM